MILCSAKEGKEGKKGQPSIGLIYRNPTAKIGFLQFILICVQLDNSLVEQLLKKNLRIECWDGVILRTESPYNWKTYKEAYEEVLPTGSALRAHDIEHLLSSERAHAKCLKCKCAPLLVAVSMDTNPYSWNEFFNMDKENPSRAFTATAIRHNVQSCNTSGTNEEPKGLRLTHQTCSTLYSKCTCISRGKWKAVEMKKETARSTMMAAVGQRYCRVI